MLGPVARGIPRPHTYAAAIARSRSVTLAAAVAAAAMSCTCSHWARYDGPVLMCGRADIVGLSGVSKKGPGAGVCALVMLVVVEAVLRADVLFWVRAWIWDFLFFAWGMRGEGVARS
jgi:hypothetical protein